ncbi:hypothetical protein ADUPG1_000878 [Aduncisulcus paluster]|uniref:AAA+ ATPase domain-containing protein n=1 Tax=Aduncisulcus paluster TaxID=2918883 RepID=A0ABQ5K8D7_9EUKA|nr:hypothetical protein ADUPG1_000878 [Aduncisulcus paluster]
MKVKIERCISPEAVKMFLLGKKVRLNDYLTLPWGKEIQIIELDGFDEEELITVDTNIIFEQSDDLVRSDNPKEERVTLLTEPFVGYDEIVEEISLFLDLACLNRDKCHELGVLPPRGLLVSGPSGVGKKSAVFAAAEKVQVHPLIISPDMLAKSGVGEAEEELRSIFSSAKEALVPTFIVISQTESIFSQRDSLSTSSSSSHSRLVAQMLTLLDGIDVKKKGREGSICIIAICEDGEKIDAALRRPGRLDWEVEMNLPNQTQREVIFRHFLVSEKDKPARKDDTCALLARYSAGFSPSDIRIACDVCEGLEGMPAVREMRKKVHVRGIGEGRGHETKKTRIQEMVGVCGLPNNTAEAEKKGGKQQWKETEKPPEKWHIIESFLPSTDSSVCKSSEELFGSKTKPSVDFKSTNKSPATSHFMSIVDTILRPLLDDMGSIVQDSVTTHASSRDTLGDPRDTLGDPSTSQVAECPSSSRSVIPSFSLSGCLLYGPSGCGKSMLARCIKTATSGMVAFFTVNGPELISPYVGQTEANIRALFSKARRHSPSIIFLDQIDSFCMDRVGSSAGGAGVGSRIVGTLLTEMDGIATRGGVVVIAACNHPWDIDKALIRPGRLDLHLYCRAPDYFERKTLITRMIGTTDSLSSGDSNVINEIVEKTDKFSYAGIVGLCEAALRQRLDRCLHLEEISGGKPIDPEKSCVILEDFGTGLHGFRKSIDSVDVEMWEDWEGINTS